MQDFWVLVQILIFFFFNSLFWFFSPPHYLMMFSFEFRLPKWTQTDSLTDKVMPPSQNWADLCEHGIGSSLAFLFLTAEIWTKNFHRPYWEQLVSDCLQVSTFRGLSWEPYIPSLLLTPYLSGTIFTFCRFIESFESCRNTTFPTIWKNNLFITTEVKASKI